MYHCKRCKREVISWYKCCPEHCTENGTDVYCRACVLILHPDYAVLAEPHGNYELLGSPSEGSLFVGIVLPQHDGSGKPVLLGIYDHMGKAQAACYRKLAEFGYFVPTVVVQCILNVDINEELTG